MALSPTRMIVADRAPISADRARALHLLKAGVLGGHVGALVSSLAFFWTRGPASGVSCLIAAVIALAFYTIGQAVQVAYSDAPTGTVLTASLVSYAVRVSALGGVLALSMTQQERLTSMDPTAVVVGTLAVVGTWLGAEIFAFSRLRFPVFDPPASNSGTGTAS